VLDKDKQVWSLKGKPTLISKSPTFNSSQLEDGISAQFKVRDRSIKGEGS